MSEPAIDITGLTKTFRGRPAVRDLNWSVPRGSIYGLLGHNGAGKSTTLGALLGQVLPDAGTVRVDGHDVFTARARALRSVGAIFESPCFYGYLSGWHNLRCLGVYSERISRQRSMAVVEEVGLAGRIHDRVETYSHGMRQRLALAQALLTRPDLLMLDEPTDGLDPQGIAEFRDTVQRLNQQNGMTILFSSHLLHEVERLCDSVCVLHRGSKVFDGNWRDAPKANPALMLETDRPDQAIAALCAHGLTTLHSGTLHLRDGHSAADVNRFLVQQGHAVSRIGVADATLESFYLAAIGDDAHTHAHSQPHPQPENTPR